MHDKIYKIILEELDNPQITLEDSLSLKQDLGFNSLLLVDLIVQLEKEFHIQICDADIINFDTIESIIKYISARIL